MDYKSETRDGCLMFASHLVSDDEMAYEEVPSLTMNRLVALMCYLIARRGYVIADIYRYLKRRSWPYDMRVLQHVYNEYLGLDPFKSLWAENELGGIDLNFDLR